MTDLAKVVAAFEPGERFCKRMAWVDLVSRADAEGQIEVSLRRLGDDWRWPWSTVRHFFDALSKKGLICTRPGPDCTLVTINDFSNFAGSTEKSCTHDCTPSDPPQERLPAVRSGMADDVKEALRCYQIAADRRGWPQPRTLTKERRRKLEARLRDDGLETWKEALRKGMESPHLCGQNDRGWTASLDFFLQPSSFVKVLEGQYLGGGVGNAGGAEPKTHAQKVLERMGR